MTFSTATAVAAAEACVERRVVVLPRLRCRRAHGRPLLEGRDAGAGAGLRAQGRQERQEDLLLLPGDEKGACAAAFAALARWPARAPAAVALARRGSLPGQVRDECIVMKGEAACAELIEAHKARPPRPPRARPSARPAAAAERRRAPRRSDASGWRASTSRRRLRLLLAPVVLVFLVLLPALDLRALQVDWSLLSHQF